MSDIPRIENVLGEGVNNSSDEEKRKAGLKCSLPCPVQSSGLLGKCALMKTHLLTVSPQELDKIVGIQSELLLRANVTIKS